MLSVLQRNKYNAITVVILAITLQTCFQIFSIHLDIYSFVITAFFALFATPILITILLGIPIKKVGMQRGKLLKNKLLIIITILLLLTIYLTSLLPDSVEYYSLKLPEENLILFIVTVYTILYGAEEFFFRGFLLFGLEPWLGKYANIVQTMPFFLFHIGKPPIELFLSFFAGLILGKIALESRSFIIPFILHWVLGFSVFVTLSFI